MNNYYLFVSEIEQEKFLHADSIRIHRETGQILYFHQMHCL